MKREPLYQTKIRFQVTISLARIDQATKILSTMVEGSEHKLLWRNSEGYRYFSTADGLFRVQADLVTEFEHVAGWALASDDAAAPFKEPTVKRARKHLQKAIDVIEALPRYPGDPSHTAWKDYAQRIEDVRLALGAWQ
jgi:hypothetical protein